MANSQVITVTLKAVTDLSDIQSNAKQLQQAFAGLKLPPSTQKQFTDLYNNITKNSEKAAAAMANGFKNKGDVTKYQNAMNAITLSMQKMSQLAHGIDLSKLNFEVNPEKARALIEDIETLQKKLDTLNADNLKKVTDVANKPPSQASAWKTFLQQFESRDYEGAARALDDLQKKLAKADDSGSQAKNPKYWARYAEGVEIYKQALDSIISENGELKTTQEQYNNALQRQAQLQVDANTAGVEATQKNINLSDEAVASAKKLADTTIQTAYAESQLNSELDQFKSRISYFFGMNNAVNLLRRALTSALNTVKDLDKVMTETAVVTDFNVGDMWAQLPEYTKRANELGVSIHSAYEAMTIFYQQGLNTNQAVALSNETLKMARIAGLDAADASDRMTNALRGFNMVLDETNAQRVDDVYNRLAAISASNVDEISTAMTKVASLAHSANMEFETTSAFLAQMIETTRESAETAGTALKTVVARFSEVKKLYSEGQLMGSDEEGETIDVNKVGVALRSAGINLNEYLTGAKGLDQIFLELASKWDSLDLVTQRYIATMAAGSRQQSRFIAMMSDYKRTVELVDAANNASGAANKMFEKTLESLETKLERLTNAWNEFIMGIANSDAIKFVVDALTALIGVLNKMTSGLPGLLGSFNKLLVAFMLFKTGKVLFTGFFAKIGAQLKGQAATSGQQTGIQWAQGFAKGVKSNATGKTGVFGGFFKQVFRNSQQELAPITNQLRKDLAGRLKAASVPREQRIAIHTAAKNQDMAEFDRLTKENKVNLEGYNQVITKTSLNLTSIGTAAMVAGGAISALGSIFDDGTEQGQKTAKVFQVIGSVISGLGMGIMALGPIAKMAGVEISTSAWAAGTSVSEAGVVAQLGWGWITLIMAALAGIVALMAVAIKDWQKNSLSGQLKQAQSTLKDLNSELDNTRTLLSDLTTDWDKFSELQNSISGLAQGTSAWKTQLVETNQAVLDLIEKYPQLADAIERGPNGGLSIRASAVEELKQTLANSASLLQTATLSATNDIKALELETQGREALNRRDQIALAMRDAESSTWGALGSIFAKYEAGLMASMAIPGAGIPLAALAAGGSYIYDKYFAEQAAFGGLKQDQFEQVAARLGEQGILGQDVTSKQVASILDGMGIDLKLADKVTSKIQSMGDSFDKLAQAALETDSIIRNNNELILEDILATTNINENNRDYVANAIKGIYGDSYEDAIEQEIANINKSEANWHAAMKKYAEVTGTYYSETDKQIYKSRTSNEKVDVNTETIKRVAAEAEVRTNVQDTAKAVENFFVNNKGIDESKRNKIIALFTGEVNGIVGDTIKSLDFSSLGLTDEQKETLAEIFNIPKDKIEETVEANRKKAQQAWESSSKQLSIWRVATEGMDAQIANDLAKTSKVYAQGFSEFFKPGGLQGYSQEQLSQFKSELSKIKMDETGGFNMLDWDTTVETLANMGMTVDDINKYWEEVVKSTNTYVHNLDEALTLSKRLRDSVNSQAEMRKRLLEGKGTDDDIQSLIAAGADVKDFELTSEGWKATASAIDKAIDKLQEYREVEAQQKIDSTENARERLENTLLWDDKNLLESTWDNLDEDKKIYYKQRLFQAGFISKDATEEAQKAGFEQAQAFIKGYDQILTVQQKTLDYVKNSGDAGKIEAYGLDSNAVEAYVDKIQKAYKNVEKKLTNSQARNIAIDLLKTRDAWSDLIKDAEKYKKVVEKIQNDKLITSEDYQDFEALKTLINQLVGAEQDLTDDFYKNNPENLVLLQKILNGDIKALTELQKAALKAKLAMEGVSGDIINQVDYLANYIASQDPTLTIGATLQLGPYTSMLKTMLQQGGQVATQLQTWFSNLGYGLDVKYELNTLKPLVQKRLENPFGAPLPQTITADQYNKMSAAQRSMYRAVASVTKIEVPDITGVDTSGSDSGSEKPKPSSNPFEYYYNETQRINAALRERERLERQYQKLLKNTDTTSGEILANYRAQVAQLEKARDTQDFLAKEYRRLLNTAGGQIYTDEEGNRQTYASTGATKYVRWDNATNTIQVDFWAVDNLARNPANNALIAAIESYKSYLEDNKDKMEEAEDQRNEAQDSIDELPEQIKENLITLGDRIRDAIITQREKQIDDYEKLSNLISDSNSKVIEELQESIELSRQIRDNTKTEEDIADREQRLAYLMRDTSGANDTEIKRLQKEIEEARQNYQDTLIDQSIDDLSKKNDKAVEQREQQIELLRAQLEVEKENGAIWEAVNQYIAASWDNQGHIVENSPLFNLLKESESFKSLSAPAQEKWLQELRELINQFYLRGNAGVTHFATGGLASFTGPAWLDGTSSHPELVLNAADTENFIQLKEILSGLLSGQSINSSVSSGDNYFDISIQAELGSDYDVDQLATRIKQQIAEDAMYRNVNMIDYLH